MSDINILLQKYLLLLINIELYCSLIKFYFKIIFNLKNQTCYEVNFVVTISDLLKK